MSGWWLTKEGHVCETCPHKDCTNVIALDACMTFWHVQHSCFWKLCLGILRLMHGCPSFSLHVSSTGFNSSSPIYTREQSWGAGHARCCKSTKLKTRNLNLCHQFSKKKQDEAHEPECRHVRRGTEAIFISESFSEPDAYQRLCLCNCVHVSTCTCTCLCTWVCQDVQLLITPPRYSL